MQLRDGFSLTNNKHLLMFVPIQIVFYWGLIFSERKPQGEEIKG